MNLHRWLHLASLLFAMVGFLWPSIPVQAAPKVVGTGTPASCTATALVNAVTGGGEVSFNCGPNSHTIVLNSPLIINAPQTLIDGGGLITL